MTVLSTESITQATDSTGKRVYSIPGMPTIPYETTDVCDLFRRQINNLKIIAGMLKEDRMNPDDVHRLLDSELKGAEERIQELDYVLNERVGRINIDVTTDYHRSWQPGTPLGASQGDSLHTEPEQTGPVKEAARDDDEGRDVDQTLESLLTLLESINCEDGIGLRDMALYQINTIKESVEKHLAPAGLAYVIDRATRRVQEFDGAGCDLPTTQSVLNKFSIAAEQLEFVDGLFWYSCHELQGFKDGVRTLIRECLSYLKDAIADTEKKIEEAGAAL